MIEPDDDDELAYLIAEFSDDDSNSNVSTKSTQKSDISEDVQKKPDEIKSKSNSELSRSISIDQALDILKDDVVAKSGNDNFGGKSSHDSPSSSRSSQEAAIETLQSRQLKRKERLLEVCRKFGVVYTSIMLPALHSH